MRHYSALALGTLVLCSSFHTTGALAQGAGDPAAPATAAPQQAPPAQPAQPAQPGQPPPGYPPGYYQQAPPPGGYGYYPSAPPPGWYYQQPPATLPYRKDEPIPPGYRLEKRPRTGLIIAGAVVTAVPYFIGLSIASAAKFDNATGFLAIPAIGPWLTLAVRDNNNCYDEFNSVNGVSTSRYCPADAGVVTLLVLDALVQTTGALLFVIGIASDRELLVRQDVAKLRLTPLRFNGGGHGLGLRGTF
jgi:hypothetical protein